MKKILERFIEDEKEEELVKSIIGHMEFIKDNFFNLEKARCSSENLEIEYCNEQLAKLNPKTNLDKKNNNII